MKAIQIAAYGKPIEVARCIGLPNVGALGPHEVVIEVEASPVNQYDLLMITGGYGYPPSIPLIIGTEGVGHVVSTGANIRHIKEGDRTLIPSCNLPG